MSFIIAVLLAITVGIYPISVPQAAGPTSHHETVSQTGPKHESHVHKSMDHGHGQTALSSNQSLDLEGCESSLQEAHAPDGAGCCNMGACHALQMGVAPGIHAPYASATTLAIIGDAQVTAAVAGRLDRPPRTV